MGASGGFPIDLILFGMIAAFLVLRLRSILGRRQGFERPPEVRPDGRPDLRAVPNSRVPEGRIIDAVAEPVGTVAPRELPDGASPTGQALSAMAGIDHNFQPGHFLDGAAGAFRIIVTAFAAGDRVSLRPLLSDDTYRAFETAIAARETAGETQTTDIRSIQSATIEMAELAGSHASITTRFVTDQVNITLGRDGLPVAGTDAVTEIADLWTFERDLTSRDPAWRLVAARSA